MVFYVSSVSRGASRAEVVWSGPLVVKQLRSKLSSHHVLDFPVISLDTVGK